MLENFPNYIQKTKYECGLVCLKIIAKFYSRDFDKSNYKSYINEQKGGVSIYDLRNIAESEDFKTDTFTCKLTKIKDLKRPIIAIVNQHHYVVIYKYKKNHFYISDPQKGIYKIHYDKLKSIFESHTNGGIIITIAPNWRKTRFEELKSDYISAFRFLLRHLSPFKHNIRELLLLMFVITAIYSILPFITRSIIDIGVNNRDIEFIYLILGANIALILFKSIGEWIKTTITSHLSNKIKISILTDYIIKIFNIPSTHFERMLFGDIMQRAQDQDRIQNYISNSVISIILSLLIMVVYSIILFSFNHTLFVFFLSGSVLYIVYVISFFNIRKKMSLNLYTAQGESNSCWIESMRNFEDIKINNYSFTQRKKWELIQYKLYNISIKIMHIDRLQNAGAEIINTLKDISMTFYGAYLVIQGEISFGTLISIQFIIGQLAGPITDIINFIKSSQTAYISFSRTNEIYNIKNEQNINKNLLVQFNNDNRDILFDRVIFRYPDSVQNALNNVSFKIQKNKISVIVGRSGCGKTTILKMLSKVYEPTMGKIIAAERELKNIENRFWRDQLSTVFQEPNLYKGTVLSNIILNEEMDYDRDRLTHALINSNLIREIGGFSDGINTNLREGGNGLSQGQKQRIIIARAIYKSSSYLLLDEATNFLDPESEKIILDYLSQEKKNRTIVMISHKLSTIQIADEIIVVDNGYIVERGSYTDLSNKANGFFKTLFNI
ncbi:peptidase domain-containing ABC transporter [Elizabethkingia anophelis]|uniref:peptidase domain-containing ABC transporter n=1 Tax=Elizabethkingia anophelis TaxID=1117645 RepID=UPI0012B3286F|nr:peptidase domain-containing ABC transporter [Elizabethkingia anophelis]QGN22318.1 ATP-binding cassette domain-containing protein [Elizabethkingia anophelis]QNV08973.1 peptidase domain-containing ABC transporter [Elizabethkingia anophelis]UTF90728.1 peptidase domain-containing ABC transporter [Elizabethkingia anophelis]UTG01598.1 peptidase domain-containing ABC transporter [Elizabethkingia anophelis]UTG05348.1 peptidase domain-containing ABC transporter [Elizabethkingia anophelis]